MLDANLNCSTGVCEWKDSAGEAERLQFVAAPLMPKRGDKKSLRTFRYQRQSRALAFVSQEDEDSAWRGWLRSP